MELSEQYRRMTETPVSRLVVRLGIPTTLSMLVTNIYNMADTYFVGQIGTSASGAIGIVFGLMALIQAVGFMYGHGAGSIIARRLGRQDAASAGKFASTSFFSAILTGLLLGVGGLLLLNPLMRLLGSTETILPYAAIYARYILCAAPLMTASFVLNNILRYEGKAALAMVGLVTGAVLNIIGDPIFMFGFHLGIAGAGLSTALSQVVSFLILLFPFVTGKTQSRLSLRLFTRAPSDFFDILKTGFPSLVRQGLSSVSTMLLNQQARLFGDAAVAAMSIVNRLCFLLFSVGLGFGQGFQPVSSFNYGAGKYSRVKKAYWFTVALGEILLGTLAVIGFAFSAHLIGIFRDDPAVIAIGTPALRIQLMALFFQPLCVCTNMLFQSIGKNGRATFIAVLRSGLCFIPTLLLLSYFFGLHGIIAAQTVSDILAFSIALPFAQQFLRRLPPDTTPET